MNVNSNSRNIDMNLQRILIWIYKKPHKVLSMGSWSGIAKSSFIGHLSAVTFWWSSLKRWPKCCEIANAIVIISPVEGQNKYYWVLWHYCLVWGLFRGQQTSKFPIALWNMRFVWKCCYSDELWIVNLSLVSHRAIRVAVTWAFIVLQIGMMRVVVHRDSLCEC